MFCPLIGDEGLIEPCALLVQGQVCHFKQHGAEAVFAKAAALVTAYLVDNPITHHIQAHAGHGIKGMLCKILIKVDVPIAYAFFVALDLLHFALAENKQGKARASITEPSRLWLNKNHAQLHAVVRIAALSMLVKVFLHYLVHTFEQPGNPAWRNLGKGSAKGA